MWDLEIHDAERCNFHRFACLIRHFRPGSTSVVSSTLDFINERNLPSPTLVRLHSSQQSHKHCHTMTLTIVQSNVQCLATDIVAHCRNVGFRSNHLAHSQTPSPLSLLLRDVVPHDRRRQHLSHYFVIVDGWSRFFNPSRPGYGLIHLARFNHLPTSTLHWLVRMLYLGQHTRH